MDAEDRPAIEASYARAVQNREPRRAEYRIHTPDGRTVWLHDETTILLDADGAPLFLQGWCSTSLSASSRSRRSEKASAGSATRPNVSGRSTT
jgi:PAS domain-containing protein